MSIHLEREHRKSDVRVGGAECLGTLRCRYAGEGDADNSLFLSCTSYFIFSFQVLANKKLKAGLIMMLKPAFLILMFLFLLIKCNKRWHPIIQP